MVASARHGTVTVLFTDIVGSTELMQRLGDDSYEQLRRQHFDLLRSQVAAFHGEEVKSAGDGLMAVFASAVNAVGCGVAMQQAAHRHNQEQHKTDALQLRVGMDAGEPIRDDGDYYGTSVNVASRLSDGADGGQIIVSQLVRRLVGNRGGFDFHDLKPWALHGMPDPVPVCEVAWEPSSEDESATGTAQAPTLELPLPATLLTHQPNKCVGREAQLEELQARWELARQGTCQLVLITGEPGIGKSSLAAEFAHHTHRDGALVLYGRCVSGSPLRVQLFVEALRPLLSGPMSERILPKHRGLAAALAPDLGGTSGDAELATFSAAVPSLLDAQSRHQPIVLVVDDLHQADEETRSLLRHTLYSLQKSPLLVVGTYPEDEVGRTHPLTGLVADLRRETPVTSVALGGLNEEEVARLIAALAGRDCDAELCRGIHEHTDGNPLFVEEVYRYLSETGALHERDGHVTADLQGAVLAVPEGVRDLIGRRLSQLSDDCNSLLNIAAVTGREFGLDALERASDLPLDRLLDLLEEADSAGIIREMAEAVGRYEFTHSLTFDTIYEELTSTRRVRLHGQTLQYADNEGVKLAYEVLGATGPYVVALGISNCPAGRPRYRAIAEHWDRVAQDCRLVLYDRRGVGFSAAPDRGYSLFTAVKDLEAVLDAVGAQRVILWGAVDGGPLAIQFAVTHPERVAGLLLLGTTPKLINGDGFHFGVNPAVIQSFATTGSTDRDRATAAALRTRPVSGGGQAAIVEIMRRVPEHAWNKLMSGAFGADVRSQLAEVRAPALIMHDPANDYIPVEATHLLHEQLPDSELEITEEYGAGPSSEGVYRRMAAFIDHVAGRGVS